MPIEYAISIDLNLMLTKWWGKVEVCEYRDTFLAYLKDPNYQVGRPELFDFSGITDLDADFNRFWSILTMVNAQGGAAPLDASCVIYAPNDTVFGTARIYQSLAEASDGIEVSIYRDESEALAHLRLPGVSIANLQNHGTFLSPRRKAG